MRVKGWQIERGTARSVYQASVSPYDVTEPGYADRWYLAFDGVDDGLASPTIAWATDEVTVVAGLARTARPGSGTVLVIGPNASNNQFYLRSPDAVGMANAGFKSRGGAAGGEIALLNIYDHTPYVLAGQGKIAADLNWSRANRGTPVAPPEDQGSGVFQTAALYIGSRGNTVNYFAGRIYGLLAINRVLSATELEVAERITNAKTGAF
ncbi:hypothetical protein HS053_21095 [Tabrizicola sp. SY72]|nr:hypothetical protein [Tabrizicola sp. SY72]